MPRVLSDKGAELLSYLPPYYSADAQAQGVQDSLGRELQRVEDSANALLTGAFPQNATDDLNLLSIWEETVGLPVKPKVPKSFRDVVLADNPAGFWRLGETTGTTAVNAINAANNGTYSGTYAEAQTGALATDLNTAVAFDGASGLMRAPAPPVATTDNWAIEFFFKTTTASQNGVIVANGGIPVAILDSLNHPIGENLGGYGIKLGNGSGGAGAKLIFFIVGTTGTLTFVDTGYTVTDTNYHFVSVSRESGVLRFYVDTVQTSNTSTVATTTPSGGLTVAALATGHTDPTFGTWTPAFARYFSGTVDEVVVYPGPLSQSQINAHFAAATRDTGPSSPIPVEQRRGKLMAYLRARTSGYGLDWENLITLALGTSAWTYHEGPGAYQVTIQIPYAPGSYGAAQAARMIRKVTPANMQIFITYRSGFIVGESWLSVDRL